MTKLELWDTIKSKYSHLENYCTIELVGIEDESPYFHPRFILDENTYISGQCDTSNKSLYALRFNHTSKINPIYIEIQDSLLDSLVTGWTCNKEIVKVALETLSKLNNHINNLNYYVNDYITNMLIGNSIKEVSDVFIGEIKTTSKLVDYMQSQKLK